MDIEEFVRREFNEAAEGWIKAAERRARNELLYEGHEVTDASLKARTRVVLRRWKLRRFVER